MSSGWRECKLGEIAQIVDCEHKTAPLVDSSEFISVRTTDISNGRIDFAKANRVSQDVYYEWTKRLTPAAGDIILAREAPVGEVGYIPEGKKVCLGQRTVLIRPNPVHADSRYLLFYLANPDAKYELISQSTGSVVEHLNVKNIKNLDLKIIDPLPEQRAIAGVLSSLDDKIDLLHRQNKTLEGMAEALWQKMFVDEADPGWKKGRLGSLIELCYGKGLKEEKRVPGKYPVVGSSGVVGSHNDFLVEGPGVVIGRKGTLGVVNYIENNFFPIDTTYFIKSKVNSGKLFFEYFLLKEFSFQEMNSDSAVPGLNREIAESMELSIPTKESIYKFNKICDPILSKKMKNERQIRTLSHLRDTLLPKLMNGNVRAKL